MPGHRTETSFLSRTPPPPALIRRSPSPSPMSLLHVSYLGVFHAQATSTLNPKRFPTDHYSLHFMPPQESPPPPLPVQKSKLCPPPPLPPSLLFVSTSLLTPSTAQSQPSSYLTPPLLPSQVPTHSKKKKKKKKKEEKNPITCVAYSTDRLSGRMVKRFASRAEDWDQFPAFSGSHPVPVIKWPPLPDDWCQRISPRTGWPGVSIV